MDLLASLPASDGGFRTGLSLATRVQNFYAPYQHPLAGVRWHLRRPNLPINNVIDGLVARSLQHEVADLVSLRLQNRKALGVMPTLMQQDPACDERAGVAC